MSMKSIVKKVIIAVLALTLTIFLIRESKVIFGLDQNTTSTICCPAYAVILYKGQQYRSTNDVVDTSKLNKLVGEKIGETKGEKDSCKPFSAYENELQASIDQLKVHKLNGFSDDYRIVALADDNIGEEQTIYEVVVGEKIKSGSAFLKGFKLQSPIQNARFQSYNQWNNSSTKTKKIDKIATAKFLNSLKKSEIMEVDEDLFDAYYKQDMLYKVQIEQNNVTMEYTIYKNGYMTYGSHDEVFKLDKKAFQPFWSILTQV